MPNHNYPNRPAHGWKPTGFLAGMMASDEAEDYRNFMSLQEVLRPAIARKEKEEADLAALIARESGQIPGYGTSIGRGKVGQAQQEQAKGGAALGTQASSIEAANVENQLGAMTGRARMSEFPAENVPGRAQLMSDWLKNTPAYRGQRELSQEQQASIKERELAVGAQREAGDIVGRHVTGRYTTEAARISAEGARSRAEAMERPPQAIARLQKELRKNPQNEGARKELSYYLNAEFVNDFQKDMRGAMLATYAMSDPKAGQEYELYQAWSRARYFDQHGIDNEFGQLSFEEFKWLQAALQDQRAAGRSAEELMEMGRRIGRIKSRKKVK